MIEFINHAGDSLAHYLAASVISNTFFLIVVLLLLFFLKNRSARFRYVLGLTGLIKLILPPFISIPVSQHLMKQSVLIPLQRISIDTMHASSINTPPSIVTLDRNGTLFLTWIVCVFLILGFSFIKAIQFTFKTRNKIMIHRFRVHNQQIPVFECSNICIPMTIGVFSKKLIVPTAWSSWSIECQQLVLDHEIAHIKRHDGLVQSFQIVIQAVYFFHPLVWLLNRQMNELREMACDDMSTEKKKSSSLAFSKCLIEIVENMVHASVQHPSASTLIRHKKHLFKRIHYQLEESQMKTNKRFSVIAGLMIGLLFFASSITFTQEAASSNTLNLLVNKNGNIVLNGEKTSLEDLEKKIQEVKTNFKFPEADYIYFAVEPETPMGIVQSVKKILTDAEILKVVFDIEGQANFKLILPGQLTHDKFPSLPSKFKCLIQVNGDKSFLVNNERKTRQELLDYVQKITQEDSRIIVDVTSSPNVKAESSLNLINDLISIGVQRLATDCQKL